MREAIDFYTNPMSRGRIARWMLEEVGQPYETHVLDFGTSMKAPEFLAINPMGKVPAIKHGDVVVTECAAICAYLADAFPAAGLAPPANDPRRGAYYRWMFFAAGPVEAAVTAKSLGLLAPEDKRGTAGYGAFEDVLNTLEYAVSKGPYLTGDVFTAADLYVGAQLGWGMQFGSIEKRPAFEDYAGRILSRPACVRAKEIDDMLVAAARQQASS